MLAGFLTGFGFILGMATAAVIIWRFASWLHGRKNHG
jgi:hypothetical protein